MEKIKLDGRLGCSLEVSLEEARILSGDDRAVAQELLKKLVQSERCKIVGDTYFPPEWNEEVPKEIDLDKLEFDLPEIFPSNAPFVDTAKVETYKEEYFSFLKDLLKEKCNSDMCCEVYWDYREEISPSTLREAVDNYKEAGYESPIDYIVEQLLGQNIDYDSDMFNDIETEILNCDNEHVVAYFETFGNLREDAYEAGYEGIDVNADEILKRSYFCVNVMFATDAERNFDMGSIVTAFGSYRDPDLDYVASEPDVLDNALTYFIHQQGHSVKEVYDCLLDNPRGWGSGSDLSFAQAIVNDIVNNSSEAMSEVTALVKLDGEAFLELIETVDKGERHLTFDKNTDMGIFNEWAGTGGLLEFQLDKPFVVPASMVRGVQIEGAQNDNYSVDSVYGLVGSCWKETLGYTDEKPVLFEEDLSATVHSVMEFLAAKEQEELADEDVKTPLADVMKSCEEMSKQVHSNHESKTKDFEVR